MMERQSRPKPEAVLPRGDIVLVPFPFTDLTTEKLRPAVIVSVDPQKTDVIIAFISSVVSPAELSETDYFLSQDNTDFARTGLKKGSTFRMRKLLTIERSKIIRRLGQPQPCYPARAGHKAQTSSWTAVTYPPRIRDGVAANEVVSMLGDPCVSLLRHRRASQSVQDQLR